jgi:predicted CXXCH cytochrome family protein
MLNAKLKISLCTLAVMFFTSQGTYALDIASTKHNLSVTGPGPVKASPGAEPAQRICVYCHTPHKARPASPLWNHTLSPRATYILPESPTQLSKPSNPPDGESRLCLSCHDGMVAIGSVVHLRGSPTTISMQNVGPRQALMSSAPGSLTNFAGDLSGTHLISIAYNDDLKIDKDKQCQSGIVYFGLRFPNDIPPPVRLRPTDNTYNGKPGFNGLGVQCSSCHDPHDNRYGKFLLIDYFNNSEDLCMSCHTYNCSSQ